MNKYISEIENNSDIEHALKKLIISKIVILHCRNNLFF